MDSTDKHKEKKLSPDISIPRDNQPVNIDHIAEVCVYVCEMTT